MESFRILGMSTGEPTMEAYLSADGRGSRHGLKVRLVDVPAEVQADSAFETCPRERIEELGKRFYPLYYDVTRGGRSGLAAIPRQPWAEAIGPR